MTGKELRDIVEYDKRREKQIAAYEAVLQLCSDWEKWPDIKARCYTPEFHWYDGDYLFQEELGQLVEIVDKARDVIAKYKEDEG